LLRITDNYVITHEMMIQGVSDGGPDGATIRTPSGALIGTGFYPAMGTPSGTLAGVKGCAMVGTSSGTLTGADDWHTERHADGHGELHDRLSERPARWLAYRLAQ
jgi:hypothetical protein